MFTLIFAPRFEKKQSSLKEHKAVREKKVESF